MNIAKQAEKLTKFLDEEFSKNLPILVLADKSLVYKDFKIKETKAGRWALSWVKTGDVIDYFNTKTAALVAAKFYKTNFNRFNEIKHLDLTYWNNSLDATFFKYKLNTTKDVERKFLFHCRYDMANQRSKNAKYQITQIFKYNF